MFRTYLNYNTLKTKYVQFSIRLLNFFVSRPIVDKIINQSEFKNSKQLKKTDGKKQRNILGVPKLCDANKAGTKDSKKCTFSA